MIFLLCASIDFNIENLMIAFLVKTAITKKIIISNNINKSLVIKFIF